MAKKEQYTYMDMVTDCTNYISASADIPAAKKEQILDKLNALADSYTKKAEYAATHRKPSKAKGPSAETKERAEQIKGVLTDNPMTTAEINVALGTNFSALQVANAVKYLDNVQTAKVIREAISKDGLRADRQYTAYFLG